MAEPTKALFSKFLNQTFQLDLGEEHMLPLELFEVEAIGDSAGNQAEWGMRTKQGLRKDPFSLIFRGPHEPPLDQGMYRVSHAEMGTIEGLFLVPVSADDKGRYYEAIYN